LKPPAEGVALREDAIDRGNAQDSRAAPAWGQSGGNGGFGSTSWGRPAFGSGGEPSTGPATSWGKSSGDIGGIPGSQTSSQSSQPIPSPYPGNLLPHERLARENMLKDENLNRRRKVSIHSGPGPEHTRGSRPIPYNEAERLQWATSNLNKKKAQEKESGAIDMGDYKIRKHTIRNTVDITEQAPHSVDPNEELPRWSMLRRRREDNGQDSGRIREPAQDQRNYREDRFAQDRAQREQQAESGGYVPLTRRAELQNTFNSMARPNRETRGIRGVFDREAEYPRNDVVRRRLDQKSQPHFTVGARSSFNREAEPSRDNVERKQSQSDSPRGFTIRRPGLNVAQNNWADTRVSDTFIDRRSPTRAPDIRGASVSQHPIPESEVRFSPMLLKRQEKLEPKVAEMEEVEEREDREDRRRKPGRFTEKAARAYEDTPKGKGKDKARRRQQFMEEEEDDAAQREAARYRAELKKQRKAEKAARKAAAPTPILLPEYISVSNLAVAMRVKMDDFVEKLEELGFEETNHDYILNAENAGLIAMEYNFEAIIDKGNAEDLRAREPAPDPSILPPRPPVVTIMGHVDHGKTTLLDWLRKSSVAATEHGGITQHIGAFSVPMPSGKIITFLDTPGHAAFLSMRQRGANVTDIVILVVAADDSVKPQTVEAIKHAQSAKVPIIVAINKIDKEESNVDRVKQDLARHGLDVEDFGGDTQAVCVSGKTGQGMDELEEAAVTLSEILDMRAETDGPAEGWVLEASIKSMGKVATVLVRRGTMRPGDFIVAGKTWARIRCLRNEAGVEIEEATPGTPVEIDGWREQPLAGDEVLQAADEAKAKSVVDYRLEKEERDKMAQDMEAINENRKAEQDKREREKTQAVAAAAALANDEEVAQIPRDKPSGTKEIYFIVKGDVSGSVEAVIDSMSAIGNKEVRPHILRSGVGQLSEFDVEHAAAANGILVNFNTTVESNIAQLAAHSKVSILDHNIIYRLVDDVKAALSKHLPPLITYKVLGEAEIAEIFQITIKGRKQKPIAGSKVRNGTISKNAKVRVLRGGEKVFDGMFFFQLESNC
jgi:translation initiation factor IF-2